MSEIAPLWHSSSRKEAMDLLQRVWPLLDENGRADLSHRIVAGPPDELLAGLDEDERVSSRDRRIFDRIIILERIGEPPLTGPLRDELERIRTAYPHWQALPGERAHFTSWMEVSMGPDTRYGRDELATLDDQALLKVLTEEKEGREGLLDAWRQLASSDSERALRLLETIAEWPDKGPVDLWRSGLWGLRDHAKSGLIDRLIALLAKVPDELFARREFANAVADVLQAASGAISSDELAGSFWELFDRTLPHVGHDGPDEDGEREDWVGFAINDPMGYLAQAFFGAMFARRLKVGEGIPPDLAGRLDALVAPQLESHRAARVIASSRLSYLFAIDPDWTTEKLLPSFSWRDEQESRAAWQGYAWQARIDAQLWSSLKPYILEAFTRERLEHLGSFRRNLAQLLMLSGIEFGLDALPREGVRDAIRVMPDDMRSDAMGWIATYLEQQATVEPGSDGGVDVDRAWRERVAPWLRRVWPSDPEIRSTAISEQLALMAIATDQCFDEAVRFVVPMLVKGHAFYVIHQLLGSEHPDLRPISTLSLVDALIDPQMLLGRNDELRQILERAARRDAGVQANAIYRQWDDRLRMLQP